MMYGELPSSNSALASGEELKEEGQEYYTDRRVAISNLSTE